MRFPGVRLRQRSVFKHAQYDHSALKSCHDMSGYNNQPIISEPISNEETGYDEKQVSHNQASHQDIC